MIERDSFIFYRSFYEGIKELDFEQQGRVYNALFGYALNGEEPDLTGAEKAAFVLIKPQIEANNRRYENGKKGGAPLGNTNAKKQSKNKRRTTKKHPINNQETTKEQPNDNIKQSNVNDNDDDIRNNILTINARARARLEKLNKEHLRKMAKMIYGDNADKTVDEIFSILIDLCAADDAFADMFVTKDDEFINRLVKKFNEDSETISDKHEYVKRTVELAKQVRYLDSEDI